MLKWGWNQLFADLNSVEASFILSTIKSWLHKDIFGSMSLFFSSCNLRHSGVKWPSKEVEPDWSLWTEPRRTRLQNLFFSKLQGQWWIKPEQNINNFSVKWALEVLVAEFWYLWRRRAWPAVFTCFQCLHVFKYLPNRQSGINYLIELFRKLHFLKCWRKVICLVSDALMPPSCWTHPSLFLRLQHRLHFQASGKSTKTGCSVSVLVAVWVQMTTCRKGR